MRSIDRFVEFDGLRRELPPFYSETGRPSIVPGRVIEKYPAQIDLLLRNGHEIALHGYLPRAVERGR